jgi:hypothetical protein
LRSRCRAAWACPTDEYGWGRRRDLRVSDCDKKARLQGAFFSPVANNWCHIKKISHPTCAGTHILCEFEGVFLPSDGNRALFNWGIDVPVNQAQCTILMRQSHLVCSWPARARIRSGRRNRPPGKAPRARPRRVFGATHALLRNCNLVALICRYGSENPVAMQENPAHSTILTIP